MNPGALNEKIEKWLWIARQLGRALIEQFLEFLTKVGQELESWALSKRIRIALEEAQLDLEASI